jgi:hypothetical protein
MGGDNLTEKLSALNFVKASIKLRAHNTNPNFV